MEVVPSLKSILKKPAAVAQVRTKEERDRETALYHANLIQYRKDVEMQILFAMEEMIELPLDRAPQYSASNPFPSDVKLFKEALRLFQPNDYDALILERNINDHCGYTLCPKPRLKEEGSGRGSFRLIGKTGKAKDFRVVEKEELEKWCSGDCARRALYVRVQLSERPAWERDSSAAKIELMDEMKTDEERRQQQLEEDLAQLELVDRSGKADLALERGDRSTRAVNGMVDVNIREKDVTRAVSAPSFGDDIEGRLATMHLTTDGYTPRFGRQDEDMEDDRDTDWKM